jgi:Fe-S cluster biogenesis protein NfuA
MDEDRAQAIRAVVDAVLAPLISLDGGSIELVSVSATAAKVRLGGACNGCPGRSYTVERVILPALQRADAAIERVEVELAL